MAKINKSRNLKKIEGKDDNQCSDESNRIIIQDEKQRKIVRESNEQLKKKFSN